MIIISQDKNKIINFNRITEIIRDRREILITDDIFVDAGESIAKYKSEERAKEVLDELLMMYENLKTPIYRMPKE